MRIGQGYDAHRFADGRRLVLGGVDIPHERGLLGHSDADALCHAVADAMLGAAALGDIGLHFPPSDPQWEGASSIELLRRTAGLLSANGFAVVNIDATVVAEAPKLASFIGAMRANIASAVGIEIGAVSVKATTEEGMGFTGRREGIAAAAAVLIE